MIVVVCILSVRRFVPVILCASELLVVALWPPEAVAISFGEATALRELQRGNLRLQAAQIRLPRMPVLHIRRARLPVGNRHGAELGASVGVGISSWASFPGCATQTRLAADLSSTMPRRCATTVTCGPRRPLDSSSPTTFGGRQFTRSTATNHTGLCAC